MKVKSESEVAQSFPTLCDPMDSSLSGSSAPGIFQARVLEWGAIAFSDIHLISIIFSLKILYCEILKEYFLPFYKVFLYQKNIYVIYGS